MLVFPQLPDRLSASQRAKKPMRNLSSKRFVPWLSPGELGFGEGPASGQFDDYFDAASDMPAFYRPSMGAAIIFLQKCAVCALAYPGGNFLVFRCHHERPSLFDRDGDGTPDRRDSQPNNPNRS
jgi:hypothetical protein